MRTFIVAAFALGLALGAFPRAARAQPQTLVCASNGWSPAATFTIDYSSRKIVDPVGRPPYLNSSFSSDKVTWTWRDADVPLVYAYSLARASGRLDVAIYLPAGTTPPIERSVQKCRRSPL